MEVDVYIRRDVKVSNLFSLMLGHKCVGQTTSQRRSLKF